MSRGPGPGRVQLTIMALAILVAPFIAMLIRVEAGLIVMAVALGAGSLLLREVLYAVSDNVRGWLRLGMLVNVALAVACLGLAAWLLAGN